MLNTWKIARKDKQGKAERKMQTSDMMLPKTEQNWKDVQDYMPDAFLMAYYFINIPNTTVGDSCDCLNSTWVMLKMCETITFLFTASLKDLLWFNSKNNQYTVLTINILIQINFHQNLIFQIYFICFHLLVPFI